MTSSSLSSSAAAVTGNKVLNRTAAIAKNMFLIHRFFCKHGDNTEDLQENRKENPYNQLKFITENQ